MIKPKLQLRPVFIRDEKFTIDCTPPVHRHANGVFGASNMAPQKRETARNYIGLLSDDVEDLHAADMRSAAKNRMKAYVLGVMAAMFSRRSEAR